jgi:magnesium chelatase family protein
VDEAAQSLLKAAMQQMHMSARAYHRVLKLGRTIADLAGSEDLAATTSGANRSKIISRLLRG